MAAEFPENVVNLPNKSDGEKFYGVEYNKIVDEITAIETELKKSATDTIVQAADSAKLGGIASSGYAVAQKSTKLALSAAVSVPASTWTDLDWDTERWDDDNMHDNATNPSRITISTAGRYQFNVAVNFDVNATGARSVRISKNGTSADVGRENMVAIPGVLTAILSVFATENCAVGDYFVVQVWHNSGGELNVLPLYTNFTATRVS